MQTATPANPYLRDPIPQTFLKTALPIVLLTSVNGLLTVVDAIFLDAFVGPDALTAVTLVFPVSMLLIALATMVSTGMTSILARQMAPAGSTRQGASLPAGMAWRLASALSSSRRLPPSAGRWWCR